jgi:glutamate synthase domain-containing protein 2
VIVIAAVLAAAATLQVRTAAGQTKALSPREGVGSRVKHELWNSWERARQGTKTFVARKIYRPMLDGFRRQATHAGELYRKYGSGQELDATNFRWSVLETLFTKGEFFASFGHPVHRGAVEVHGPVIQDASLLDRIRQQRHTFGGSLLRYGRSRPARQITVSAMPSISGMSFPQLSANSILSLMYIHLRLAKEGMPQLFNTGEGGPKLHLALLAGDANALREEVLQWGYQTGQIKPGSHTEARVAVFIDSLMRARDQLFREFSAADLGQAQIVAQFGTALNGIRGEQHHIDWSKLEQIGRNPHVAMVQYKLKQASKRGARLDKAKVDDLTAAMREIDLKADSKDAKSPELNPEMESKEALAGLILKTRQATGKPVSIKFGLGDVADAYQLMSYLKQRGALPDHIQLDGRGLELSPGSGNAPPMGNTSLPINEATIAMDAILKKLRIRDRVYVEATGDIQLPADGVEKLALGADGISAARLWLGMGLGCAKVKACAAGSCPYGIASRSGQIFAMSLDPNVIARKGFAAAKSWYLAYTEKLAETGSANWTQFRQNAGLARRSSRIVKADDRGVVTLRSYYAPERVAEFLDPAFTRREIETFVYGAAPERASPPAARDALP